MVLLSVVLIHYRPTNGVVCQVLFNPGKPSVAAKTNLFSIVMDNVDCQWEVVEGVLGNMSLGAPRQAGRQAGL
jgi:hypothetical protein